VSAVAQDIPEGVGTRVPDPSPWVHIDSVGPDKIGSGARYP